MMAVRYWTPLAFVNGLQGWKALPNTEAFKTTGKGGSKSGSKPHTPACGQEGGRERVTCSRRGSEKLTSDKLTRCGPPSEFKSLCGRGSSFPLTKNMSAKCQSHQVQSSAAKVHGRSTPVQRIVRSSLNRIQYQNDEVNKDHNQISLASAFEAAPKVYRAGGAGCMMRDSAV